MLVRKRVKPQRFRSHNQQPLLFAANILILRLKNNISLEMAGPGSVTFFAGALRFCAQRQVSMVSRDFQRQIEGYGLTTAHILYRLPDHPSIVQSYVWQEYDLSPDFPELRRFLDFWTRQIEGALHSVTVAHAGLIRPAELSFARREFYLN
jgi:uncharacterized protein Usg